MESNEANVSALYVPSTITADDGIEYPVKSIGANAFNGNPWIVRIYFGEGIEEILIGAVRYCTSLEEINLPSTLKTYWGHNESATRVTKLLLPEGLTRISTGFLYGFTIHGVVRLPSTLEHIVAYGSGCSSLYFDGYEIDSRNKYFKTVDGCWFSKSGDVLYGVPSSSALGTDYTIPDTVITVATGTFFTQSSITKLTFGKNVVNAVNSITHLNALKTLYLNAALKESPFTQYCQLYRLEEIIVEEGSSTFSSHNGALYDNTGTTLFKVPAGTAHDEITFLTTTKTLEHCSLLGVTCKSIIFNEGLQTIAFQTFYDIRPITGSQHCGVCALPSTLNAVSSGAFMASSFSHFDTSNNDYFSTGNNGYVLYDKNKTRIVAFTSPRNVVVDLEFPDTVVESNSYLFTSITQARTLDFSKTQLTVFPTYGAASGLEDVTVLLPPSLTSISTAAIYCRYMKTLTIPENVAYISPSAFYLSSLQEMIFLNPGKFRATSIFAVISRSCVIKGYRGSTAEDIAKQYTLMFEPLD